MATKSDKAVKISQKHLLGIQDLSISDVNYILSEAKQFIKLNRSDNKKIDIPLCLWDERLSTVGAFNITKQLDVNISKKVQNIDKNAAAFILQGAIDYLKN